MVFINPASQPKQYKLTHTKNTQKETMLHITRIIVELNQGGPAKNRGILSSFKNINLIDIGQVKMKLKLLPEAPFT